MFVFAFFIHGIISNNVYGNIIEYINFFKLFVDIWHFDLFFR